MKPNVRIKKLKLKTLRSETEKPQDGNEIVEDVEEDDE